jgi:hypothetical protein
MFPMFLEGTRLLSKEPDISLKKYYVQFFLYAGFPFIPIVVERKAFGTYTPKTSFLESGVIDKGFNHLRRKSY